MNKAKSKASKRQLIRERQRKQQIISRYIWVGAGIVVLAIIGILVWQTARPAVGEVVPIPISSSEHVPEDTQPGPYPSDPPAGGVHFAGTLPAKLYLEEDLTTLPQYPEGYLVHNLEHGYVIFWYNCDVVGEAGCEQLITQLQEVIDTFNGFKVMAFPWKSLDIPVAATSWGRLQRFESFDPGLARRFVRNNRNKAPEPNAP